MFFYECDNCYSSLDIKCADLSSSYSKVNQESKHVFHPHPLIFIQNPMDEHKSLCCPCCYEPLVGALYICVDCPLIFHKTCIDGSNKFKHPSHRTHPLFLVSNESFLFCKLCQKQHCGFFYCYSLCDFTINIFCAWSIPIVEDKSRNQHPFTLLWRRGSFICDACDTEGNYMSYTCSQEHTRKYCKICFNEVKLEGRSYSCVKAGCNYIVHVNCALEDYRFYEVVERESQCEELYGSSSKYMLSSINRVIEVSEEGEATKIEHFSHEGYCLVLADKMEEETDRKCDGCMLPVSLLYCCSESECNFCLHKNCSELPRVKHHWSRRYTATLNSSIFKLCDLCKRLCSGFFYDIGGFDVCLRCAKVADIMISNAASDVMVVALTQVRMVHSDVGSAVLLWISNAYHYYIQFFTNLINTSYAYLS
ncbi:hypothetical protein F3Y22_tig00110187pilonHSYRG00052 [Hibiscus syriacus]|uniref:Phorbol-ester/DAG-type domain-containing protein n=1 Tax=Hibiscus syriacus TaxID=106335 RepID=A0A6A3BFA2_HIBSY|nr:hypothetical protein F3Y22_tig00110187pilonHSYRG00052 [Hibiscus syriacus]